MWQVLVKSKFSHVLLYSRRAKGDRDFRISDLVKNPDETDI